MLKIEKAQNAEVASSEEAQKRDECREKKIVCCRCKYKSSGK